MKILAIDTSTDYMTIAVSGGKNILGRFHKKVKRNHSRLLAPEIKKLLKKTKTPLEKIDYFAVGTGPGSFTGLRIAITTVKGFSYALEKKIVAIPTFDAIAANVTGFKGIICPVLDARKNKVYAAIYKSDGKKVKRMSGYLLLPLEELTKKLKSIKGDIIFLGDMIKEGVTDAWQPGAEIIAKLAMEKIRKKKFVSPEKLEPMYLYSKECDITGK